MSHRFCQLIDAMNVSIPAVYSWSSRASQSPIQAEYIIIERQPGVVLLDVLDRLRGKQKVRILDHTVDIERRLTDMRPLWVPNRNAGHVPDRKAGTEH